MNPDEVWVVYNAALLEIISVFSEKFMAEKAATKERLKGKWYSTRVKALTLREALLLIVDGKIEEKESDEELKQIERRWGF